MAKLTIKHFSCIDRAEVDLARLTILVGPQASGKSVISKLIYYFYDAIESLFGYEIELDPLDISQFEKRLLENFKKSFPPSAWGSSAFDIQFEAGPVVVRLYRSKPRKSSFGNLKLELSEYFINEFNKTQEDLKSAATEIAKPKSDRAMHREWDIIYRVRRATRTRLAKDMAEDFVLDQTFIPAGRSFFTSMGKALVAFEHGGFLDPLTISFGKYFLAMRDQLSGRMIVYRSSSRERGRKDLALLQEKLSEKLFSGRIVIERNDEYIQTTDGRKIPFAFMSSGQQELLPLWLVLGELVDHESGSALTYIEEPEAHLFPSAQGVITEYLATLLGAASNRRMLITTHSPYILAKINNLLKAGALGAKLGKKESLQVEDVVPKVAWLSAKQTSAYAIVDRQVVSIMCEDELIDAVYLDAVSSEIAQDFDRLLELEFGQ